jgi:hypothetical protein
MPQEDDVISQADALMRRHRSFVARATDDLAPPVRENPEALDADIPLLTEIVDTDTLAPENIDAVLDALQEEIRNELSSWLVEVLPAAVANASQQILTELDAKARNTLLPRLQETLAARRGKPPASDGISLPDANPDLPSSPV